MTTSLIVVLSLAFVASILCLFAWLKERSAKLGGMKATCGWCGRDIMIGEPITLYMPKDPRHVPKSGAFVYTEDSKTESWQSLKDKGFLEVYHLPIVGCSNLDCADTAADYMGTWVPPGRVHRHLSIIEQMLNSEITQVR